MLSLCAYSDLYVNTMISLCILWSLCANYDLYVHTMISMCILWSLCAYYDLYVHTMISMCILWSLCAYYDFYVHTMISMCILCNFCVYSTVSMILTRIQISPWVRDRYNRFPEPEPLKTFLSNFTIRSIFKHNDWLLKFSTNQNA